MCAHSLSAAVIGQAAARPVIIYLIENGEKYHVKMESRLCDLGNKHLEPLYFCEQIMVSGTGTAGEFSSPGSVDFLC